MGHRFGLRCLGLVLLLMSFAAIASAVPTGTLADTPIYTMTSADAVRARATDDSVTIPVTLSAICPTADPCDAPNQGVVTVHIATSGGMSIGADATAAVSGGAASVSYTLNDPAPGDYSVTISYYDAGGRYGDSQATTTLTIVPGLPVTISLSPGSTSLQVGTYVTEVASVTDANGNPVADGTPMHWLVDGVSHSNISREDQKTTGGSATLSYTSTDAGLHDFSVEAGTPPLSTHASGFVTFTPGPAASITLTPSDTNAVVGTSASVTATVVDQYGNDVADGTPVNFQVSGTNTTSATRNTFLGSAEFSYRSDLPGVDTVTATSGNVTPAQANVTWLPPVSPQRASLTIINPLDPTIVAMVSAGSNGTLSGTLIYSSRTLTLSQVQLTSLIVDGNQATLFGTATVSGANVGFRLDASANLRRGTVRLRLSNGYDSGYQPVLGLLMTR